MWMELTELEAAYISKWSHDRLQELTVRPGLSSPATKVEIKAIKAISEKSLYIQYHTATSNALTPEIAEYLKVNLRLLQEISDPKEYWKIKDKFVAELLVFGLTVECFTDDLERTTGYGVKIKE